MKTYINKPFCIYVAIVFFISIAVTIAIFANQHKSDKHDIVDEDGYIVDKFIYDVSKDIIERVETLGMQAGVNNKKIEKAYNLELLYTADRTYIYRLRHKDKDLIFKYALYSPVTRNEVKIARELKHDNIVEIYSAFYTDDRKGYFVVTATMDCALSIDYSRKHPGEIKDIVRSVVHALKYLHDKNIVHCDIKLSNILVKTIDGKKVYKICDFGGAQYMYDKVINPVFYTLTDVYSAPETYFTQIFTKSTDIWCLGHTIWFYMQQRIMFVDQNGNFQARLYEKYLKGDLRIDWTTKNLEIVGRCCDRSPGKRATYDEILEWCNEE